MLTRGGHEHFLLLIFFRGNKYLGANIYTFCMSGAGLGVDRNGAGLGGARPENRQASLGQSSLLAGC